MRSVVYSILLSVIMYVQAPAQSMLTGNSISAYVDQLPKMSANADDAYNMHYPKGKKTIYQNYEEEILAMLNDLLVRSNHQSRLLSMLAGKYEEEGKKYDFSKLEPARDKLIDQQVREFNSEFYSTLKDNVRVVIARLDVISKQSITGTIPAEKELAVYQETLPVLFNKVKKGLTEMEAYMKAKGYSAVLDKNNSTHPHYIQLLEVRGLMLDRIRQLIQQASSANNAVAMIVDICRKHPESCK